MEMSLKLQKAEAGNEERVNYRNTPFCNEQTALPYRQSTILRSFHECLVGFVVLSLNSNWATKLNEARLSESSPRTEKRFSPICVLPPAFQRFFASSFLSLRLRLRSSSPSGRHLEHCPAHLRIHLEVLRRRHEAIEDDHKYWEGILSALAIGWLDVVVKLLRLHGSYQLDQLGSRETENGLVEAIAVLVSQMPRLRPELPAGRLGVCYRNRSDFIKAWEKWRAQITKLDCSGFWVHCDHQLTREGLRNMLQIMLGNTESLATATFHWMELFVSHFLYVRPFTVGLESMYNLAQKCTQAKPVSYRLYFDGLLLGILGDNTEVGEVNSRVVVTLLITDVRVVILDLRFCFLVCFSTFWCVSV